ncbi:SurA N-terminal domain-containing protein [Sphingomonas aerophila]|uniref:Peptidyl-prolyl cis-trans isomerase D n=1 Tax=Sphingomonas aerophila TaxID=1344948 RepID=A0A7W9BB53_9SPHN|nr:SurA N-terminal domain-containing protein [Sphingomonas aerophila]MBB5713943.1 peptidyl-prolyl cis-trans isomerase D [Sphingomonas aerophila]
MLSFFRRIINSKVGVIVTLGVLAVIAIAFAAGDITGLRSSNTGGLTGGSVAKVGDTKLTIADLRTRAQTEIDSLRQQQPDFDVGQYLAAGGLDRALDQLVTGVSFEQFGHDQGMVISKRSVDGTIASFPAFQGPNGKFDPAAYQRLLSDRKLTDAGIRTDLTRQLMGQQLTLPIGGAAQVPEQLALPYASLLLERRQGQIGIIPNTVGARGPEPTDADITGFYRRNLGRYNVPERRSIRFALVTPDAVKARATPTEAEIATAYRANPARFAAAEKRDIEQVVALDQNTGNGIAARVKGGASLADAARAAGLDASTQTGTTKAAYAAATAPAVADAVFAAARGAVVGPVRANGTFTVARTTIVSQVAGKTLDQARGELSAETAKRKSVEALVALHDQLDDQTAKNATFDELISDAKLTPQTSPALLANGTDPLNPGFRAPPTLQPLLAAAFQAEEGDDPQLVPIGQDGSFGVVALGRVIRAAPRPLAEIRDTVQRDFLADRAHREARRIALAVLAKTNAGTPFAQALTASGLAAPRPAAATRAQLAANPSAAPPALVLMFSMAKNSAKLLEVPGGWMVVRLDTITSTSAAGRPQVVAATRADLARNVGNEYLQQFARAVRADVGVKIDTAAVKRVKADLSGSSGDAGN